MLETRRRPVCFSLHASFCDVDESADQDPTKPDPCLAHPPVFPCAAIGVPCFDELPAPGTREYPTQGCYPYRMR